MHTLTSRLNRSTNDAGQSDKGFTLVELLVVIVILGVLAAVIVFRVGGITDTGKSNSCSIEEREVNTALQAYRAQNGAYPTSTQGLAVLVPSFLEKVPSASTATGGGTYSATAGSFDATNC